MESNDYKKRQKALKQRVEKLPSNPVTDKAVERLEPNDNLYEDFEIVHELVSAAFAEYEMKGNLKRTLKNLGDAIISASKKA